jgi:hypothetical protein
LHYLKKVSLFLLTILLISNILPAGILAKASAFDTLASHQNTDFNNDVMIDNKDLAEIARMYGTTTADFGGPSKYDLNSDGIMDIYDLVLISKNIEINPVQYTFNVCQSLLPGKKTIEVKLIVKKL